MAQLELLLVGLIVLVAMLYSAWALMPAPVRQRLARRLLVSPAAGWFPRVARRRLEVAAAGPRPRDNPCNACNSNPGREHDPG